MAENKTKPTQVSVTGFVAALDDQKKKDSRTVIDLMKAATGESPKMWGPNIIGFGTRHFKYESGREGDFLKIGFSPRKPTLVLYGLNISKQTKLLDKLGKHKTGKGCLYIKKLEDVDVEVLKKMIAYAVKSNE